MPKVARLPTSALDTPYDFDPLEEAGAIVGSGVIELLPANTCMVAWAMERSRYLAKKSVANVFHAVWVSSVSLVSWKALSAILVSSGDLDVLDEFAGYVPNGSLCGFGVQAPNPLKTAKRYWPEHFQSHIEEQECPTGTCVAGTRSSFCNQTCLAIEVLKL